MPRHMYITHSDTMNEETFRYTDTNPFSRNQASAETIFARITTATGTPVFATRIPISTLNPSTPP